MNYSYSLSFWLKGRFWLIEQMLVYLPQNPVGKNWQSQLAFRPGSFLSLIQKLHKEVTSTMHSADLTPKLGKTIR